MNTKFPYKCIVKESARDFTPIMIDYDSQMVWWQKGQASDNGEWLSFDEVIFIKNDDFIDLTELK